MKYDEGECAYVYARYVALLLHHKDMPEEHGAIANYQEQLEKLGFNDWGRALARWPKALEQYLDFCKIQGWEPVVTELDRDVKDMPI